MFISDFLLLLPALLSLVVLVALRRLRGPKPGTKPLPRNSILVDGSNVLFWGDGPSALVLSRVLRALEEKGHVPIVYFDANVGYVLADRYYNETRMAGLIKVPKRHICVVDKGVIADEAILAFASEHRLRVVTNDNFRDWRVQFPHANKKGILVGGTWQDGSVVWRGKL